jgi:hypothetical protein
VRCTFINSTVMSNVAALHAALCAQSSTGDLSQKLSRFAAFTRHSRNRWDTHLAAFPALICPADYLYHAGLAPSASIAATEVIASRTDPHMLPHMLFNSMCHAAQAHSRGSVKTCIFSLMPWKALQVALTFVARILQRGCRLLQRVGMSFCLFCAAGATPQTLRAAQ